MKAISKFITIFTLGIIAALPLFGQIDTTLVRHRSYEGEGLYGFMNGGSDLFYEYGFQSLIVDNVSFEGFDYQIESYTMNSPLNAFGIYSIHIFKPLKTDYLLKKDSTQLGFDCLSKYQLQVAYCNKYISIVFNAGEKAASGAEKLLLSLLGPLRPNENSSLLPAFVTKEIQQLKPPFSGRLRYAVGPLGLSAADEEAIPLYEEIGTHGLWIYSDPNSEKPLYFIEHLSM